MIQAPRLKRTIQDETVFDSIVAHESLQDLVATAKASPGKYNYGDTAPSAQLAVEMFKSQAGQLNIVGAPYRRFSPALQDQIAGHTQLMPALVGSVLNYHQQGTVRILAVFSEKRLPSLLEVPTGIEAGRYVIVLGRCGDGASAGWRVIVGSALEAPTVIAGFDDVARRYRGWLSSSAH